MKEYIKIEEPRILNGRNLEFKLSSSKAIRKYFKSDNLVFQYDKELDNINPSILHIPAFATIITVAWALGCDVYAKTVDRTYLEALNKVKSVMEIWYPWFSFSTEINVDNIVTNRLYNNGYALLFTGGIDSTVSYIRNRDMKPNLIAVWGTGRSIHPRVEIVENRLNNFAYQEGVNINFVGTNFEDTIDFSLLQETYGLSWYARVFHSIFLTGTCAPLTCIENIKTILIASTFTTEYNFPWGSHPYINKNIRWADVEIVHDGYELTRQEKIRHVLKEYILKTGDHPFIRTCVNESSFNCGKCWKCFRTITGLVLENIDPNKCGWNNVNAETFDLIKNLVQKDFAKRLPFIKRGPKEIYRTAIDGLSLKDFNYVRQISDIFSRVHTKVEWTDIQKHIPEQIDHNFLNSKAFFEWFKTSDISGVRRETLFYLLSDILTYIYYRLPMAIQNSIRHSFVRSIYGRVFETFGQEL